MLKKFLNTKITEKISILCKEVIIKSFRFIYEKHTHRVCWIFMFLQVMKENMINWVTIVNCNSPKLLRRIEITGIKDSELCIEF